MIPSPSSLLDKALLGNDSAWHLAFYNADGSLAFEFGREDYHAEIQASLPGALEGGVYKFVVEGLTDEHYGKIAQKDDKAPKFVKLFLYWRDTNSSVTGYLANLGGLTDMFSKVKAEDLKDYLVADLAIVSISRKAGTRRYETTINARERIFDAVTKTKVKSSIPAGPLDTMLDQLLKECSLVRDKDFKTYKLPKIAVVALRKGEPVAAHLRAIAESVEIASRKLGRGMMLIRAGTLHFGVRPIPFEGDAKPPKKLALSGGLLESEAVESKDTADDKKKCRQFKLTLKGRPDLFPGDMVEFDSPLEDVSKTGGGLLGAIGDLVSGPFLPSLGAEKFENPLKLYVQSVEHKQGRTSGFSTVVTGLEIKGETVDDRWEKPGADGKAASRPEACATAEVAAAKAMCELARNTAVNRGTLEAGEVRSMVSKGTAEPPSQTVQVWRGLTSSDGAAHGVRRLPVQRPSPGPIEGVAYATPYAWGKTGLVLPRYPGTRVLVGYRDNNPNDPIELGAVWQSGAGPDSQPGDWWLILPAAVPQNQRETIADDAVPEEPTGAVSQDLIDADGNRVIELGEFTLRVGRGKLKNAGQRPERASDADSVTLEHADSGAKIVIKKDGSIQIKGSKIDLEADGAITLKAAKVDVQ